jgi:hypothetical protein
VTDEHPASDETTGSDAREMQAVTLEGPRPLSKSFLWDLETQYYERTGVDAWSSGDVPFTLASAPRVASVFAQLVTGFVQDCQAGHLGPFDPSQPVYVLEIGAGTGRLAYYFLEALDPVLIAPVRVVYVLSDRVESNLRFWSAHPKLRALIDAGRADVALYSAGSSEGLHLVHADVDLEPGRIANPMAATASYLFDVLPQDLYCAAPAGLEEELVEVLGETEFTDPTSAEFFEHLYFAAHHVPAQPSRYGERVGAVLEEMGRRRAGSGSRFLFPSAAIATIDGLRTLSGDRLLFVVGEREEMRLLPGTAGSSDLPPEATVSATAAELAATPPDAAAAGPNAEMPGSRAFYHPSLFCGMGLHGGSISLPVDFDVIEEATKQCGAALLRSPIPASGFTIVGVLAGEVERASLVRERYASCVVDLAPDDLLLAARTALSFEELALDNLLALLRVTRYDPIALAQVSEKLAATFPPRPEERDETVRVLERISELDFSIANKGDVPYAVATLLGRAAEFSLAIEHFVRARETYGPRSQGYQAEAMCHFGLGQIEEGVAALEASLELDPSFAPARALLERVQAGNLTPPTG